MLKVPFQQVTGIFWSFVKCQFIPYSLILPLPPDKWIFLSSNGAVWMDDQNSLSYREGPGTKPWETILPLLPPPQPQEAGAFGDPADLPS